MGEPTAPAVFVCSPVMDRKRGRLLPAMQDARRDSPHLGVYLLLAHLERAGCPCDLIDWVAEAPEVTEEDIARRAARYDLVFFSCNSMNWGAVRVVAQRVRELNPAAKLCIGGPHPTLYPEPVARSGLFDAAFRGEADRFIATIYEALLSGRPVPRRIPGLWAPCAGADGATEPFQDARLRELDWRPAYERIPDKVFLTLPVETSRGCRYQCAFCSIPSQKNWRAYPVETAVEQLHYAREHIDRSRYRKISIIDDTFTDDHERILQLCAALPEDDFRGRLMYDATLVDLRDRELCAALAPFTSDLLVGAEVSTIADAKKILKAAHPKMVERAAQNLMDHGIAGRAVFSFIIGFPWQTAEDCLHTVNYATNLILDYGIRVYLQWYWPMPGSRIWRTLEEEDRVDISIADTPGFYRSPDWFYSIRQITPDELQRIDERIRPIQMCLTLGSAADQARQRPLEYSAPDLDLDEQGWETRRNPFIAPLEPELEALQGG